MSASDKPDLPGVHYEMDGKHLSVCRKCTCSFRMQFTRDVVLVTCGDCRNELAELGIGCGAVHTVMVTSPVNGQPDGRTHRCELPANHTGQRHKDSHCGEWLDCSEG